MVSIDKAAIVFSIAIALVGVAVAAVGSSADNSPAAPSQQMSSMNTDAAEKAAAEKAAAERAAAERAAADAAAADAADAAAADSVATAGPQLHIVETAMGSGAPGCETSNACYLPADITISIGDTVQWNNVDKAAHTVSGGNPADGPSGVFDSSLLMAGLEYSFTFNDAGNYDYFCMVHPWMTGSVTVN
ncbi:MAG: plastocyanin/azurin family copper-binding protein [Crenarchaeota archaeon]|nr:plastocyanin/azurin family copper-binding protein [Thermoproteota archaeon]